MGGRQRPLCRTDTIRGRQGDSRARWNGTAWVSPQRALSGAKARGGGGILVCPLIVRVGGRQVTAPTTRRVASRVPPPPGRPPPPWPVRMATRALNQRGGGPATARRRRRRERATPFARPHHKKVGDACRLCVCDSACVQCTALLLRLGWLDRALRGKLSERAYLATALDILEGIGALLLPFS